MQALFSRRVVLVTGKGGVGRTTIAAALARAGAERGRRTLLAEIGEASQQEHSRLAALFGEDVLPPEVAGLAPGIDGVMLQTDRGTEEFLASLFRSERLSRLALRTPALRRLLHAAPSFHEMGLFNHFLTLLLEEIPTGEKRWDFVILDMPATGHALALTALPQILLSLVSRGPIADALRAGQAILNDSRQTVAAVVTLPELLPVSEAMELLAGLEETGVHIGVVLANRVPTDPFTTEEHAVLAQMLHGKAIYGAEAIQRIHRSEQALSRLHQICPAPVFTIADMQGTATEVVDLVSEQLLAQGGEE